MVTVHGVGLSTCRVWTSCCIHFSSPVIPRWRLLQVGSGQSYIRKFHVLHKQTSTGRLGAPLGEIEFHKCHLR